MIWCDRVALIAKELGVDPRTFTPEELTRAVIAWEVVGGPYDRDKIGELRAWRSSEDAFARALEKATKILVNRQ